MLSGSMNIKTARKTLVKLTPAVNLMNVKQPRAKSGFQASPSPSFLLSIWCTTDSQIHQHFMGSFCANSFKRKKYITKL